MIRKGPALIAASVAIMVTVGAVVVSGFSDPDPVPDPGHAVGRATADPASAGRWVGTWSTSAVAGEPNTPRGYPDTSIRNVVHTSIGGSAARIQLSNTFGDQPVTITHATLAVAAAPSSPAAVPGTLRELTFAGSRSVTIPAGRTVTSDGVRLRVPDAADLLITTYSPTPSGAVTYHPFARQTSYLAPGDHAADPTGTTFTEQSPYWRYLTAVDVWTADAHGAVVVLGDSITDGITSTSGTNHRWTDFLAARLLTSRGAPRLGVLNQGISGNRLLVDAPPHLFTNGSSARERLGRDALSRTDATALVVELGINDIIKPPQQTDPRRIVAGLRALVQQAHARGVRVVGATLTPFRGHRLWRPRLEAVRQAVNTQIRTARIFDAVADFDVTLRDPSFPSRLRPGYDSGDHIHPSDAGFQAMATSVDLRVLKAPAPAAL